MLAFLTGQGARAGGVRGGDFVIRDPSHREGGREIWDRWVSGSRQYIKLRETTYVKRTKESSTEHLPAASGTGMYHLYHLAGLPVLIVRYLTYGLSE